MEEEISRMKTFLKDFFNNEQTQSPTSEESTRVGNYSLDPDDVSGHVIDWVINYLDNRKCPYSLAVSIAKEIALQISASLTQNEVENFEKMSNSADLYSEAISKIPAVCNTFSSQSNLEPISSTKYSTSVFAIRNKRRKMEDRHVILHDLNAVLDLKDAPYQSYYAVFDGHSGIDAACYASAQLHVNIAKHPDFLTNTPKAIIDGYQITDKNFLNKCNKLNIKSGCTALSALIRNNTIFLSWLGDSQAVLVKGGVPVKITSPHKPDREDERQRIEELGGHVSHLGTWRVNGLLAVTRAIGDPDQKPFISSEPELDIINLDGTEDFLILACDGLWDGISPEDASSALYRYLVDSSPDDLISPVAAKLVHQSKIQGSEDNITAIVVFLRDVKDIVDNVDKFLSNSSYYAHNHDFMSMNGNMKIFSMDSNSESSYSKPTVLELNAASSKKLKNAANVMSSAGFGSTSYAYQFVENLDESSFHSLESSGDASQHAYMSQAAHSAACFAPEATALSELPTPPIDDMLASQQFDNFCSTDLYKQLNNSLETSEQQLLNANETVVKHSDELLVSNVEVPAEHISTTVADADNQSLCNVENNSDAVSRDATLSPDEAIGIASDVVSSTIETAVKCLEEESVESTSVQSSTKLNPYAKPFVMKSFFNPEESDSMTSSFIGDNLNDALSPCEVANTNDSQPIIETAKEIDNSQNIPKDIQDQLSNVALSQSNTEDISSEQHMLAQSVHPKDISDMLPLDVHSNEPENKLPEQLNVETVLENVSMDHQHQSVSNKDLLIELEHTNISETHHDEIFSEKSDGYFPKEVNIQPALTDMSHLRMDFEKLTLVSEKDASIMDISSPADENKQANLHPLSSESPIFSPLEVESVQECAIQSAICEELRSEQNQNLENVASVISSDNTSMFTEFQSKFEDEHNNANIEKVINEDFKLENKESVLPTDVKVDQTQVKETEQVLTLESFSLNSEEAAQNQNTDLSNVSDKLNSEVIGTDIKSKFQEIEKSIVDAVIKSENSESSSFVEPMSLISTIKDELISAESEVPSDPSVVEPVAVDLKSLPEGIPEAEGVTEDIDSDSEKDGGWSYMKVTGSKSKTETKTSKITKSNDVKSNTVVKSKQDVSKPNLDVKSKAKSTIVDKTKSSVSDKSKTVSQDKTKSVVDKTKGIASVDKTRTLGSSDKFKKTTVEKKVDVKSKVLKSSTTSTITRVIPEKTSRIAAVSGSTRKEVSTTTTTTAAKPTRPTTLLRTAASATKTISTTVPDKSASSNRTTAKPRVSSLNTENKSAKQNVASSAITKGTISMQSKSSTLSSRTPAARPATTVPAKTSTIVRTTVQKSTISDPKLKLTSSSIATARKPLSAASKTSDVKEVKNTVNKQILAKKTTVSRIESTLTNKRVVSHNNKSAPSKTSAAAKVEINKRDVPKTASSKLGVKQAGSKVSQDVSKNKEKIIESIQDKTDETKNISNVESDQKNVTEAAQVVEEKFILETTDKEIPKEVQQISNEEPLKISNEEQIVENGSLTKTMPTEEVVPVPECNTENL